MTDNPAQPSKLRSGLIETLRAARAAERDVLATLDAAERDAPADDGGWSAKDVQTHLSAWRQRQIDRLVAAREGRDEPALAATETDQINAIFHAERAEWPWDRVVADADATAETLIAEIERAAPETLAGDRVSGSIMGNGSEHTLTHLPPIAERAGVASRVIDLAGAIESILDRGDWPTRPAAYARYNLACFHSLAGRLERARPLLRWALREQEDLRDFATHDEDLQGLWDEIPSLIEL